MEQKEQQQNQQQQKRQQRTSGLQGENVTGIEEQLFKSPQASKMVASTPGGASHSTPVVRAPETSRVADARQSITTLQIVKDSTGSACRSTSDDQPTSRKLTAVAGSNPTSKKRKSSGIVMQHKYQKALYMLEKIHENVAAGTVHERDEKDKARYMKIVVEYEKMQTDRAATIEAIEAKKRNHSHNEGAHRAITKKAKRSGDAESATPLKQRNFSYVARDHLQSAIIDENSRTPLTVQQKWVEIDVKLSSLVMNYVFDNPEGPHPEFDSSESLRGYRVVKCADQFSLDFLAGCVAKISDTFVGLKLKLIPAKDIPRRPRGRIWLPPMDEPGEMLLRCIKLQNKDIPAIEKWELIKGNQPIRPSNNPMMLAICAESLDALEKADYRLRFGIRKARMRVYGAGELPMGVKLTDDPKSES
ncbi:PREDICTED: uncharacterized protein LOC108363143 [Rhagoletis zephyria]|uniref:uncharacterized protein LOC108363143 n=1 Tax=Rhagoletis zephyria TaxID=28612 RepID=UPI0008118DA8|nr:PREDICTED: uncharacterized protein LOC108363143 [Rhagoletis zephyria]